MAERDIVHLAIAPPIRREADLIKKAAAILSRDPYEIRLLLAGKIPKIVAHYQTIQEANSTAQNLRALGLVVLVCKDSELRRSSRETFKVHTLELAEGEVLFWSKGSDVRRIRAENVFLILEGRIQVYSEEEVTTTRLKFSLPATVMTGGIPVWRKVTEKARDCSIQTEAFLRLYDQTSPEPRVDILQLNLDYSFLGVCPSNSFRAR